MRGIDGFPTIDVLERNPELNHAHNVALKRSGGFFLEGILVATFSHGRFSWSR